MGKIVKIWKCCFKIDFFFSFKALIDICLVIMDGLGGLGGGFGNAINPNGPGILNSPIPGRRRRRRRR